MKLLTVFLLTFAAAGSDSARIKGAAQRSVALLERVSAQWKTPCISCHHQTLPALALESARAHGLAVDEAAAQLASARDYRILLDLDAAIRVEALIDPAMSEGSMLMGAHASGVKPSLVTAAYALHIAGNQLGDGHWALFDARPPQSHSEITATAIASRAVGLYHPSPRSYVDRARRWLLAAQPADTEGVAFRLLGLAWTGASASEMQPAVERLAGLQRKDGGWSQTARSAESDPYSTAESLAALRESKMWTADDTRFKSGIQWLLDHQATDGSWHVKSRIHSKAPVSPPYFESGFPYGHDQFLSAAATSWAVRALAEALPTVESAPKPRPLPDFDASKLEWARIALLGTVNEVAKINPSDATPAGTTALMIAAHDGAKVETLLRRGARAKVAARSGYDALMIASLYRRNAKAVEMLLAAGVPAQPAGKVRFDASALAHAVMSNDPEMVRLLLARGADPSRGMRLLGGMPNSPMLMAANFDNVEIVRLLARAGVKVDAADADGMTALSWAALSQRAATVRALLELGADGKHKDRFGLTPLDHTADIADAPAETATVLRSRGE
ncbi:MAG: ankyrin repeat domain-containing protein [Bryobacteraceae bacterium]